MKYNINNKHFLAAVFAVVLGSAACMTAFPSCEQLSVLENREDCPSWLDIHLTGVEPGDTLAMALFRGSEVPRSGWGMGSIFTGNVLVSDSLYRERKVQFEVPRGWVAESAVLNPGRLPSDGDRFLVPEGEQAPRFYGWNSAVSCTGEFSADTLVLGKQFCNVRLDVGGISEYPCPYSFVVRGSCDGWDRLTFTPVEGDYTYAFAVDSDLCATFRLPRQGEDWPLELDIVDALDGKTVQVIPLLVYFQNVGYNWNARSLSDIIIRLTLAQTGFTVTAEQWVSGDDFIISK